MKYADFDNRKKAFIFELDDVLYPEKDYLYQVYYLFAGYLEYIEFLDQTVLVNLMVQSYEQEGKDVVFERLKEKFKLDDKYLFNFNHLMETAKLPLKLLLHPEMLALLQEIVVDRKQLFVVTNGKPALQLNKIKQTDWQGLEPYLTCYFADEIMPKPEPDVIHYLIKERNLQRRDLVMIGNTETDLLCSEASGIDYVEATDFLP
jgi:FMN phosphatase YigB (HAD superfamily)